MKKAIIIIAAVIVLLVIAMSSLYTVAENEYACVMRFSEIVKVNENPGCT